MKLKNTVQTKLDTMQVGALGRILLNPEVLTKSMSYQRKWPQMVHAEEKRERQRQKNEIFLDLNKWTIESRRTADERGQRENARVQTSLGFSTRIIPGNI